MAEAARHLHVIDPETGELHDRCPECLRMEDEIAGLQRDIRGWAARYAELKRDREAEARAHELWPAAVSVVKAWRKACGHPRSSFGAAEFELIRPFLTEEQYGPDLQARQLMCLRAVAGAAFDPFVTTRKNGSRKRHDGLDLIFRNRSKFEEFANRAPKGWRQFVGLDEGPVAEGEAA